MVVHRKSRPKKPEPVKAKPQSPFWMLVQWGVAAALWGVLIIVLVMVWYAREIPQITQKATFDRRPSVTILANDGSVIARYGDLKGQALSIDDLPPHVVQAILAIEDRRFYYHFGLDPIGLIRAMVVNTAEGRVAQGGSTITQQLAKNLFLSQERTYKRKIQEAILSIWLEKNLTKDEILSAYLNRVYMGGGAYGVEAASRVYFDKSARELTLNEAAMLAGLLKAPTKYSPKNHPEAAQERAKVVLAAMKKAGYLDKNMKLANGAFRPEDELPDASARYFADWARDNVSKLIEQPETDITVETTLDPDVQKVVGATITEFVEKNGEHAKFTQGAAVVLRADGSVVAMTGGKDYNESEFNRATSALRPPGSSFKPIVYLTALENGMTLGSVIHDAPISIAGYRPQNFGGKYYGDVTLAEALTLSLNTVSVQLGYNVGMGRVVGAARRMGITADLQPDLSLALGAHGVPMIQMAGAYTVIANGGYATEPYGIRKITDKSGKVLWQKGRIEAPVVFPGDAIFELQQMMKAVVIYGTGQGAQGPYEAAGKTGTSQDYRDIWFSGFTGQYVGSVWFGNDNNSPMRGGTTGGSYSARAWRQIMTGAQADKSPSPTNGYRTFSANGGFRGFLTKLLDAPPAIDPALGAAAEGAAPGSVVPQQGRAGTVQRQQQNQEEWPDPGSTPPPQYNE
jgi:penicillin-binding protein 1A